MPHEVEVKVYAPDHAAVIKRLESLGAVLEAPRIYERNVRYEDESRSLGVHGQVLRLRQDTRARLTYKEAGVDVATGIKSRLELEVEVSDFAQMDTMLSKLGFNPSMIYEKYRTTYTLDGAEIVLDEMPYGNFVEIEGEVPVIEVLLERLGLSSAQRYTESYTLLFDFVCQHLALNAHDLTFDNFKGVTVPQSAFEAP